MQWSTCDKAKGEQCRERKGASTRGVGREMREAMREGMNANEVMMCMPENAKKDPISLYISFQQQT